MPIINISMSDVQRHPHYVELTEKKGTDFGVKAILYDMGMDVTQNFEGNKVRHRSPITGKVFNCVYYAGMERTDEKWIRTRREVKSMERFGHPYDWELFS